MLPSLKSRSLILPLLALLMFSIAGGCSLHPPASRSCAPIKAEWIRTEMFFGLSEAGKPISQEQWRDFVDQSITPRFPDGLTFEYGHGQYRADNHELHKESTAILILLHRKETSVRDDALLTLIAQDYDRRFHQESVLRCDTAAQVEFVSVQNQP